MINPLEESGHFFVSALKSVERVKGIEPVIVHGEEDWLVKMLSCCRSLLARRQKMSPPVSPCWWQVQGTRPSKWVNPLFYFCSSKLVRRARVAQPVAKAEMNWFVPCGKPLSKYS